MPYSLAVSSRRVPGPARARAGGPLVQVTIEPGWPDATAAGLPVDDPVLLPIPRRLAPSITRVGPAPRTSWPATRRSRLNRLLGRREAHRDIQRRGTGTSASRRFGGPSTEAGATVAASCPGGVPPGARLESRRDDAAQGTGPGTVNMSGAGAMRRAEVARTSKRSPASMKMVISMTIEGYASGSAAVAMGEVVHPLLSTPEAVSKLPTLQADWTQRALADRGHRDAVHPLDGRHGHRDGHVDGPIIAAPQVRAATSYTTVLDHETERVGHRVHGDRSMARVDPAKLIRSVSRVSGHRVTRSLSSLCCFSRSVRPM